MPCSSCVNLKEAESRVDPPIATIVQSELADTMMLITTELLQCAFIVPLPVDTLLGEKHNTTKN